MNQEYTDDSKMADVITDVDAVKAAEPKEAARNEQGQSDENPKAARKAYTRKQPKPPTVASVSETIEAKKQEIEAIKAEIDGLTARRNELFILESEGMGLISIMADPEKAMRLAMLLAESGKSGNSHESGKYRQNL